MLRTETLNAGTLDLLSMLMEDERLSNFILVGGTALALQIGHRKSIDLDFFLNILLMKMNFFIIWKLQEISN